MFSLRWCNDGVDDDDNDDATFTVVWVIYDDIVDVLVDTISSLNEKGIKVLGGGYDDDVYYDDDDDDDYDDEYTWYAIRGVSKWSL